MKGLPEVMVFVKGGQYKEQTISDLYVDQHEFTNDDGIRVWQTADPYQLVSIDANGDRVEIVDSGKDPVKLWEKIAGSGPDFSKGIFGFAFSALPLYTSPQGFDKPDQPMVNVNAQQARQFCEAQGKRLLTPLEWEWTASQAGKKLYSTKSGKRDIGVHYQRIFAKPTREVCKAKGYYIDHEGEEICDMNGNVGEWTYDPSLDKSYMSGGAWSTINPQFMQADSRLEFDPRTNLDILGFRCAKSR